MWPFRPKPQNAAKARDKPRVRERPFSGRWLPVYRARADNTMRGNEAIYAAVSRISNTVALSLIHI